jgi:hypothetical protein
MPDFAVRGVRRRYHSPGLPIQRHAETFVPGIVGSRRNASEDQEDEEEEDDDVANDDDDLTRQQRLRECLSDSRRNRESGIDKWKPAAIEAKIVLQLFVRRDRLTRCRNNECCKVLPLR